MTRRVLAISSAGGHWVQLRRLRHSFDGMDVAFASVYPDYSEDVAPHRYYSFPDVNRFNKHMLVPLTIRLIAILLKERPQVVVTTGSFPGLVALTLAKTLLRAKTIWIDSIANCEQMSTSGQKARRMADVYLTQWPHLAKADGPSHWGAVL
ncbi:UDP-N-acetylglucosamine--LPS N-acetylglucosamine transferase [Devosia sp. PTR5]|uniref:UDP-N-acetylglucosamine--LPS N-acetylglucosamine transferase n=1 Tax=Devosia oryzisoli TaxID=2774138 RepID=A0A927FZ88_9HYPH|nr:UDP-N-acetylglucosamine--LPS N-acetylglucosamine transferase [Devosia oryzisoli]MBD8066801.1 UDP-N-acetylglucosamine--LPS N-acetylglucosamine transferase [Devosia oryzisoli]